jgi:ribonuclease P protein component
LTNPHSDHRSFPASVRLRRSGDFQRLRRHGRRVETANFILFFQPSPLADARLGLTVSRKVGNSVVRNRVKRRVREFFRTRRPCFVSVFDLSVVARSGAAILAQIHLEEELTAALRRLSLLDQP